MLKASHLLGALASGIFAVAAVDAQRCQVLKDINANGFANSSRPSAERADGAESFLEFGGRYYFAATSVDRGRELWRSKGARGQDVEVFKDVRPVPTGSAPRELIVFGNKLVFVADDGVRGARLWCSDGTSAGTVPCPFAPASIAEPRDLITMGSQLFFTAVDGRGRELWVSDGTMAGTRIVADIAAGAQSSDAHGFFVDTVHKVLLFAASDGSRGVELWRSDGSSAGSKLVADLVAGPSSSKPGDFVAVGGKVLFSASGGSSQRHVFVFDGNSASLLRSASPLLTNPSFKTSDRARIGSKLLFSASNPTTGTELYITDGSPAGTRFVADLRAGFASSSPDNFFTLRPGKILFSAEDTRGRELWITDGTASGTTLAQDIYVGNGSSKPNGFVRYGSDVYFRTDNSRGTQLWAYRGTKVELVRAGDVDRLGLQPSNLTATKDRLLFGATDRAHGTEVWTSNGASSGTKLLRDVDPGRQSGDSNPRELTAWRGKFFFTANGPQGYEPCVSDGTTAGTKLLADLQPGTFGSGPHHWTAVGDKVFFNAMVSGRTDLWTTDGTRAGTRAVGLRLTRNLRPYGSTAHQGRCFFLLGSELWSSDGGATGTQAVAPALGLRLNWLSGLVSLRGKLFFVASTAATGEELWSTDGTARGTKIVRDIVPGAVGSTPRSLTAIGSELWFAASNVRDGAELWVSDGSTQGTRLVDDLYPGSSGSFPSNFVEVGGRVLFTAVDQRGRELWAIDDSKSKARFVKDIYAGRSHGLAPRSGVKNQIYVALDDVLIFRARTAAHGEELWRSDGTLAGTQMIKDILPGPQSALPEWLTRVGDDIYFQATEPGIGTQLYRTDGSASGTRVACRLDPHAASGPADLLLVNGSLMCLAIWRKGGPGREVFRVTDLGSTVEEVGQGCGRTSPRLRSISAPTLGKTWRLALENFAPGEITVLFAGVPADGSLRLFGCPEFLDVATKFTLVASLQQSWKVSIPIRADRALAGLTLGLQAWGVGARLPFSASNGVRGTIGN